MKLFYYVVIFTGIMLMFNLAGIDTASNKILSSLGNSTGIGTNTEVSSRSISNTDLSETTGRIGSVSAWGLFGIWLIIFIALILASTEIGIFTVTVQIPIEIAFAYIYLSIGAFFALDMWSIFTNPALDGVYWVKWIIGAIVVPLAVGFIITLIESIRGND